VKPATGVDFTGTGPALVSEWSGGAHCCYTFHVFQLGDSFKALPAIPLLDADESAFVRRPDVKGLVLATADYSASPISYGLRRFSGRPGILSFRDGKFEPDMR